MAYKILDNRGADSTAKGMGRRYTCLEHISRKFVDALRENEREAMWFIDENGRLFSIERHCMK